MMNQFWNNPDSCGLPLFLCSLEPAAAVRDKQGTNLPLLHFLVRMKS